MPGAGGVCVLTMVKPSVAGFTVNEFWPDTTLAALPGQSPEAVTRVDSDTVFAEHTSLTWPVIVKV